jgi:DNA-directed RNA polymerase
LSLINLDAAAAPLVNLINCEEPRDIYGELAVRTIELFDSSPWASFWRNRLKELGARKTRELLKTPGLTFSYASTERGNAGQIFNAYYDICGTELGDELGDDDFEAVLHLVGTFRQACREMLPGPVQTMTYIQSLVRTANSANRFLEWATPSGLQVSNIYPELHKAIIYLQDGTENTIADGAVPNTIRTLKTVSSAPANYVHSLDSAHLARTVVALATNQMEALCVHDAYAVRAAHAEQFHVTNREELVQMYREMFEVGGPLALLRQQNGNAGDAAPPIGSFNLMEVQQAAYACS